jgi:hypothetical protein
MSRFRSVPFWPTLIGLALLCGAAVTCHKEAADAINDASRWTNVRGAPLDAADDVMVCPDCQGDLVRSAGYDYRCKHCGATMQVKRDSDGRFIWHR